MNPVLAQKLNSRFLELEAERVAKLNRLAELEANPPEQEHAEDLLDRLPILTGKLANAPEELQRELFEVFNLEIRYDARTNVATIRVTLDGDTMDHLVTVSERLVTEFSPSRSPASHGATSQAGMTTATIADHTRQEIDRTSPTKHTPQHTNRHSLSSNEESARSADLLRAPCTNQTTSALPLPATMRPRKLAVAERISLDLALQGGQAP
ncbi:hypothetical protein [Nonomuraea helvata]|uniref:Uncharacterized protein n=1 Tax=Nonomuraea helvata TaxID=37484 RepID=A0ABV5SCG2_9ACTN